MSTLKHVLIATFLLVCPLSITAVNFGDSCDPSISHLNAYLTYVDACDDPSGMYACAVAQDGHCELDRDDECAGGAFATCLNFVCVIKGVPIGGFCGVESTQFVYMDQNGQENTGRVERDNCTVGAYCVNGSCIQALSNGAQCTQDRECWTNSCFNDGAGGMGTCGNPPDSFKEVQLSTWVAIGISILVFMILVLLALWLLHRYQSKKEHEKIRRFFDMQEQLRQHSGRDTPDMTEGAILLGTPRLYAHSNKSDTSIISDIRNRMSISMPGSRPQSQLIQ
ncbi:unnamed protein product [Umbelopsis vinacea]